MKIRVVIVALFAASLGTTAYANGLQMTPVQPNTSPTLLGDMNQSMVPSDTIIKNVKHELAVYGVSSTDVSVTAQGGTVTLTGTVVSNRDFTKAKAAAMRVNGVRHVDTSGLHVQTQRGQG